MKYIIAITAVIFLLNVYWVLADNPDKASIEISDEAITYHYSWDDEMTATVPLTDENAYTTCVQLCKNNYLQ